MSKTVKYFSALLIVVFSASIFFNPHFYKSIGALYAVWNNFSPEKNQGAYLIPSDEIVLEQVLSKDNISEYKIFSVNHISILIPAKFVFEEIRPTPNSGGIIFPQKGFIHIDSDNRDFRAELICNSNMSKERTILAFGEKIFSTTFQFDKYLMELTPRSASVLNSPRENLQLATLLPLKVLLSSIKTNKGYWLESNNFKGIQIGDPDIGDEHIVVHIYPSNDQHYELLVGGFSQEEMNSFLSTLTFDEFNYKEGCA